MPRSTAIYYFIKNRILHRLKPQKFQNQNKYDCLLYVRDYRVDKRCFISEQVTIQTQI